MKASTPPASIHRLRPPRHARSMVAAACGGLIAAVASAQSADTPAPSLNTIQVNGDWLGTGLQTSVKDFAGARTVVRRAEIDASGASSLGDALRRIPGVQVTENSGSAGSVMGLNIGVRGLTGRYSPRSTVLLDGIPMAVAPYGSPQISFAPVSLANIDSIDVVRGGGAVRYGPQNVGGIINFTTRAIPIQGTERSATVRYNHYGESGGSTQYSAFVGSRLHGGLGLALLYAGEDGQSWREGSDQRANDVAVKARYAISDTAEIYGKLSYYESKAKTPGGLTAAQFAANPFRNTRPNDNWSGDRKGIDVGYINTFSETQEFEVRAYYNESFRQSTLIGTNAARPATQPRDYTVLGVEPRYTQRFTTGATVQDVTVGYRFLRERTHESQYATIAATGVVLPVTRSNDNTTDAHSLYVDDQIALGPWRVTPGVRMERVRIGGHDVIANTSAEVSNNKLLPSLAVSYLASHELTLFGNYSTSFGTLQHFQLNLTAPGITLKPELAKTVETGARWTGNNIKAEATVFAMRFDNQVQGITDAAGNALFYNLGKTEHKGFESSLDYSFDKSSKLAGLTAYARYTYTEALQKSGVNAGRDVPFYSRNTDTLGLRHVWNAWGFDLSTTHQSRQFADDANSVAENAAAGLGLVPGFRVWNAQLSWKAPGKNGVELIAGLNNLADKRYYTRTNDGNRGRLVGAPRTTYVEARIRF